MKKLILFTSIFLFTVFLFSCKRDRIKKDPTVKDFVLVENYYKEIQSIADDGSDSSMVLYKSLLKSNCAQIDISETGGQYTMVIDFGDVNCLCQDGRERRGAIVSTWNGAYRDVGTTITHTPQGYYVNDIKLEGTKIVENKGLNDEGNLHFSVEIDGKVTLEDGTVMDYKSSRIREWIEGADTQINWLDDEYLITGTAEGTNSEGLHYTMVVTKGLHIKLSCAYIVEGELEIVPEGYKTREVDFGDGTCDSEVTVTVGNKTFTIGG